MSHTPPGRHAQQEPAWLRPIAVLIAVGAMLLSLAGLTGWLMYEKWWGIKPDDIFTVPGRGPIVIDTAILWGPREIRMETQMAVDLDAADGPKKEGGAPDFYMWSGVEVSSSHGVFVWTEEQRGPELRDCAISLATQATTSYVAVKEGMRLCVATSDERVALIVIKKRDGDAWLVDGTVWKQRLL